MRRVFGVAVRLTVVMLCLACAICASRPALAAQSRSSGTAAAVVNTSGRLATVSLYDLGGHSAALYSFASTGSKAKCTLFWRSVRGAFQLSHAKLACGDLNGDGYPDAVVLYDVGHGDCALYAFLSNGHSFRKTTAWHGRLDWDHAKLAIGDANGDGLDDLYVLSQASRTKSVIYLFSAQTGSATGGAPTPVSFTESQVWGPAAYRYTTTQIAAGDVNADGHAELVSLFRVSPSRARLDVFSMAVGKLSSKTFWQGGLAAAKTRLACGDVNADGKADVLLLCRAGRAGVTLRLATSQGSSFATPHTVWQSGAGKLAFAKAALACGDPNSDGKADAVILAATSARKSRLTVLLSRGTAFAGRDFWEGSYAYARARLACAPPTPTVIPQTTKVLSGATVADATTLDGSTYTFTDTSQTAGLAPGDVIVGKPDASQPQGIFAEVTAVSDGGATVSTTPASLEDAVSDTQFAVDYPITQADFTGGADGTRGLSLVRNRSSGGNSRLLTFRVRDVAITQQKSFNQALGPVTLNGTITLSITLHVACDVSWHGVKSFVTSETTTVSDDLTASVSASQSFSTERTIASWGAGQLQGFVVMAGPVPLYFQPELSLFVGVDGHISAGVQSSVQTTISGTLGVAYQNGSWHAIHNASGSYHYAAPQLSASGTLKGYAGAQLGLSLYDLVGPYVRADGYAKLAADITATPWWTLTAGLEGRVGAEVGINLGIFHWGADWHTGDFDLVHWTLAQATGPAPTSPTGTIAGLVEDTEGNPLDAVDVAVNDGVTTIADAASLSDGSYAIEVPVGSDYSLAFSKDGYASDTRGGISVSQGETTTLDPVTLVTLPSPDQTRIVLTWGEDPWDLDSHLVGPNPDGSLFHIYYSQPDDTAFAELDHDCTTSYGPETITIYSQFDGVYRYAVHDYSDRFSDDSWMLSQSGATVHVYRGDTLKATFSVPSDSPGTLWTVFTMYGDIITPVNTMSYESDPASVLMPDGGATLPTPPDGKQK